MSGHSKWATIKHKKGAADAARAKNFAKLLRQVEVAAREGGGDPTMNASLRAAVTKARENSVPMDTIDRAVKRGSGELEGVRYESVMYEGYAAGGVAMLVDALSDNRNRTGAEVRSIFSKNGGAMAEPGAVAWQFERKGVIMVPATVTEDDLMTVALDAGAEDIQAQGDTWQVTSAPGDITALRAALEEAGMAIESAEVTMLPQNTVPVTEENVAKQVLRMLDALEDNDDVQNVYANFDISDELFSVLA
ncbi:MAG TPA: YebC/PmpR family DNA-binding transcriptional regulator [Acidimicrobiales bacterium]|nr:YebC/PmpR family DNA-binding transcriptional regulator [Acidimicrobiales bacterium]